MTFKPWMPPAGYVVDPPVHTKTEVDVLFSDRSETRSIAGVLNWSGEGDGPKIIAYSVVEEYVEKREPREWWALDVFGVIVNVDEQRQVTENGAVHYRNAKLIRLREVLPEPPLDLTKITTPFGLLDGATQAALKAHGGPMEFLDSFGNWTTALAPTWGRGTVYRVAASAAPAKPAPREVVAWAVVASDGDAVEAFVSKEVAEAASRILKGGTVRPLGFLP